MSMQRIKCPYCGHEVTVAINDTIKMSATTKSCSKCHKFYTYQGNYGQVKITKK